MAKTATALPWTITEKARNIHHVSIELANVRAECWALLQSDVHFDNPHCDRDLLVKHLNQAKERDAMIADDGDWFCAMQGKWDKRSRKDDLRPEHRVANYTDALVNTSADFLQPYRHLLGPRAMGNHETAILKAHESNLTERLVQALKDRGSDTVQLGGYSGFIVFQITHNGTRRATVKLHYHHGYGGGGAVTRGVIQTNRQAVYLADADICWNGHTHDAWQVPIARVRLNQDCTAVQHTRQVHLRTAGYKEEFGDGYGGWHIERGGAPKPTGAAWLRFYMADADTPEFEITEAR